MKRLHQLVRRQGIKRHTSYLIPFVLTLFVVTTVLPVIAEHSSPLLRGSAVSTEVRNVRGRVGEDKEEIKHLKFPEDASTQLEQGKVLYDAGRFSEAVALWQQAVQRYQEQGDRLSLALSLNYLSLAYQDLGRWQDAQRAITQSLNLIQTASTHGQTSTQNPKLILAQSLNTQGSLQLAMGKAEAALETWKQAAIAYAEAGDETGMLGSQINQAQAMQTLGLYRRATTTLEQVNQTLQAQPDSLLKAAGLRSLGVALQVVGDLQQSQKVLEQSLAIAQRIDSSLDTSATLFSLGNTARALQEFDKALELYQKATEKATTSYHQLEAQLNQLSLLVQTQQWETARNLLPQIQSRLTQLSPSRATVYAQVNLSESLMQMASKDDNQSVTAPPPQGLLQASTTLQNPVESGQGLPSELSEIAQLLARAVQQARMLKDPRAESYALGQLGHLYELTQQWAEAQNLTQNALSLAQSISASDITYRWQWQLGRIFKHQGEREGVTTKSIPKAIVAYSEAVNTLQSLRSDLVAINPDVQFSFRESVEPVYRELVELLVHPLPNQQTTPSQENLKQARQVIELLQLAELDNFFREACLTAKPEQIDQVDPTAAVIYPIILPDRLAVILSLPGQPLTYHQTPLSQNEVESILDQSLQSLNRAFSSKKRLSLFQQIYDWLIRPTEAHLAASSVKTLVFVLDGSLRNLPMAALHDGKQYLVEKYSIALNPGLQLLEARSLLRQQLKALTGGLTESREGFAALPGVESELSQISSELRTEILLNQEFTKETLEKRINQAPFPIIHLATHAQFSSKVENTFLLTWDGRINVKDFDRLLRTRERQTTNPIELLVLSACQTATGDKRATLGLAGLAVRSGARSTLATLWSVWDESTAEFMAEFYRELTQTQVSKAEALRQAQLLLLKNPKYEHPYFWAPFVLVGNWL
jgi:CHAT domain-containing protein/lipopolysaccharide biosynthesis regulator YciM